MKLQELQNEEKELVELLTNNRAKQREIHTNDFLSKYGIKIGDTIEFMDGRENVVGIFDRLQYRGVEVDHPYVKQFKSDGKVGKREKRCWWSDFETLKLVKSA